MQDRCIGPETRALFAAILSLGGSQSIVSRVIVEHVSALLALKLSRCMRLSRGLGAPQRLFPSGRIGVRAVAFVRTMCACCVPSE